jgi:hypothetical protein
MQGSVMSTNYLKFLPQIIETINKEQTKLLERVEIAAKLILFRSQGIIREGMTLEQIIKILTRE